VLAEFTIRFGEAAGARVLAGEVRSKVLQWRDVIQRAGLKVE
jgi:hypothetical protein